MNQVVSPEFIRLPKPKQNCPHSGLSRTGLYNLTVPCSANGYKPAVPAKCLRQPGNLRGVWLIPYAKLIEYLNALPQTASDDNSRSETSVQGDPATGPQKPHPTLGTQKTQRRAPVRHAG